MPGSLYGAAISAALVLRDIITPNRSPKLLEIGTVVLFGALAIYAVLGGRTGTVFHVRLIVDSGLLLIVLISLAVGQPYTLQYARESVSRNLWSSPSFLKTHDVITSVWALAFFALILADVLLAYVPSVPPRVGILIIIAALYGAFKFTVRYPKRGSTAAKAEE